MSKGIKGTYFVVVHVTIRGRYIGHVIETCYVGPFLNTTFNGHKFALV